MKAYKVVCPSCKAELKIDKSKEFIKCEYCGSKVFLDDGTRKVEVTKTINKNTKDETKIKEIESKERIKLKQMELDEKRKIAVIKMVIIAIVVISVLFVSARFLGSAWDAFSDWRYEIKLKRERKNMTQIPISIEEAKELLYDEVKTRFENAGFTNVTVSSREDLVIGLFTKDGQVESITINGDSVFWKDDWVDKDANIVIVYHTFKSDKK